MTACAQRARQFERMALGAATIERGGYKHQSHRRCSPHQLLDAPRPCNDACLSTIGRILEGFPRAGYNLKLLNAERTRMKRIDHNRLAPGARGQDSARTLWITGWIAACAIGLGLVVAQLGLLATVVFAGLLAFAAILHNPRRGLISSFDPGAAFRIDAHAAPVLGITGLNPLNLTFLATLAGLFWLMAFPASVARSH